VGLGLGRFTGGGDVAGVGLGVVGGRVGVEVGATVGVVAGAGVCAGFVFAGVTAGSAGTIRPSSHIRVTLSLFISNSIVFRLGFNGASGRTIGFPFIKRRAEPASDFEYVTLRDSFGSKLTVPPPP